MYVRDKLLPHGVISTARVYSAAYGVDKQHEQAAIAALDSMWCRIRDRVTAVFKKFFFFESASCSQHGAAQGVARVGNQATFSAYYFSRHTQRERDENEMRRKQKSKK